ncbi:recombinase family protein [Microbacterium paludicola]|uniref:recombinase family protein n=1 Tax=Microbacterium paludicola TaxID=300019 RepID=UPI0009036D74|nr:recombinase family protein [Microbacterium paludicola]APF33378.1 hypothetical protein BO218_03500 [Microbacterium paludicola]
MPDLVDLYVRLSIWDEAKDGLERQESDLRGWAKKQGLTVRTVWRDAGVSGYKTTVTRAAFKKATEALIAGEVGALAVWRIDRLSRRGFGQVGVLMDSLEGTGRRIVFVDDGRDTSNPNDRLGIMLASEQARQESESTSKRVKNKNSSLVAAGLPTLGKRRYGYLSADPATGRHVNTVEHPEEAQQVRQLFTRYLAGASIRTLSTELGWRPLRVRDTLSNAAYIGKLTAGGLTYEAAEHVARLVSKEDFEAAQTRLQARSETYRGFAGPGGVIKHPLSGIMRCAVCGGAMSYRNGYLCLADLSHPVITGHLAEDRVRKVVALHFLSSDSGIWKNKKQLDLPHIEKQIASVKAEEDDILTGLAQGLSMSQLLPYLSPLREKREALEAQRDRAIAADVETRVRYEILKNFEYEYENADAYQDNKARGEAVLAALPLDELRQVYRLFDIFVWPGRGAGRLRAWPVGEHEWYAGQPIEDVKYDFFNGVRQAVKKAP